MARLTRITVNSPDTIQIWGFHGPCSIVDVNFSIQYIAKTLQGKKHIIHIMSGTHGLCKGQVGAVATNEIKFANEDRSIKTPQTIDKNDISLNVHDFNTNLMNAPDNVTARMMKLNSDIRKIASEHNGTNTFILAYCCSAGTQ